MALNAYLTLTGETQGEIKGGCTQAGREDSTIVLEFRHEIVSPRDAASGLPTGKRQHKPITVVAEVGKHSPLMHNVLVNNENISEWTLKFWQPSRAGKEFQYYTIELVNASVAGIRQYQQTSLNPETMKYPLLEELSFCYQKIMWTYVDGGISAEDDWETPIV